MDLTLDPLQLAPVTILAAMYAVRARALAAAGRPVDAWRQASFHSGLALIAVALISPLGALSDELFLAHMAEHLIIADLGALLIVLGLTGPLLAPLLRTHGLRWLRRLAHPAPAFALWAVDLLFWHVAGPHEAAVRHAGVHALQHMLFAGLGINMWMALLGPLPKPSWFGNLGRLVYVLAVRLTTTVLANVFVWSEHAYYGVPTTSSRRTTPSVSRRVVAGEGPVW
ncbi:MAG: cytochrome c oxidase assembly protein [Chloroflexota bacterium]|nr:cytochrome c oxidase assembly protein [Chloroflexota bacterium]